ncbi:MAG: HEAT repeat domain-containing protein [Myxococcales bacterium]|nr:HEAT repeat domain-containing protein [Myxococcales bacterium]
MISRREERARSDSRTSSKLVQAALQTKDEEAYSDILAILHARGDVTELQLAQELCESDELSQKLLGIEILGQMGWSDRTHLEETVALLIGLLKQKDPALLRATAIALGHRGQSSAIPALLQHKTHKDALVRFGVVFGLLGQEDERAIKALIELSSDDDAETRNWATFGLGSQIDINTPAIQAALLARAQDKNHEIRGEAIVGLARRKHPQAKTLIRKELSGRSISALALEAAEELGEVALFPDLEKIRQASNKHKDPYFLDRLDAAIEACRPQTPKAEADPTPEADNDYDPDNETDDDNDNDAEQKLED